MQDLEKGNARVRDDYLRNLVSGRIGRDGQRTFHCHFGSTRVVDRAASGGAIDYLARLGDFAPSGLDRQDLEHLAGDVDQLRQAAEAVAATALVRRGRTAERVLIKQTFELPAIATAEQRQAVAEAIVADWKARGHEALAAVHGNGQVQPHVHVAVTARPVLRTFEGWAVDRDPACVPLRSKAATRAERARVAELINAQIAEARFHPGRLIDTGIEREPEKRLSKREWHREGLRERSPEDLAAWRQKKRAEAMERRLAREVALSARKHRQEARLAPVKAKIREEIEADLIVTRPPLYIEAEDLIEQARKEGIEEGRKAARPQEEDLPPTVKQLRYLSDLTDGNHELLQDEAAPTRGQVGQAIRKIEHAREAERKAAEETARRVKEERKVALAAEREARRQIEDAAKAREEARRQEEAAARKADLERLLKLPIPYVRSDGEEAAVQARLETMPLDRIFQLMRRADWAIAHEGGGEDMQAAQRGKRILSDAYYRRYAAENIGKGSAPTLEPLPPAPAPSPTTSIPRKRPRGGDERG